METKIAALVRVSSDLVRHLDEQVVIQSIINEAVNVVGAEACSVILLDENLDECYFYSATGPHDGALQKIRFKKELGIVGKVLQSGKPISVADTERDPHHYGGVDKKTGFVTRSLICAPLNVDDKTIGVVEAVNKKGQNRFSQEDLQLLTIFSNYAAVAINNARAFNRSRTDATAFKIAADRAEEYVGQSPAMKKVRDIIGKVARTKSTVLITGESGSGKEVAASAIHKEGPRKDRPFICVNCAALQEDLLASELFGHEKGAFTGAVERRRGRFELAHTGTIFLDEIAAAQPSVQAKLLRVLETQVFERLGGSETVRTDARIIAATNMDLVKAVRAGAFREDLYHRLNVVSIHIPPLRERKNDIAGLFRYFAQFFASEMKIKALEPTNDTLDLLTIYHWPGNVRELKNLVERVTVLSEKNTVTAEDLLNLFPSMRPSEDSAVSRGREIGKNPSLWELEKQTIEQGLAANDWNQTRTAHALGITRHHLRYRIKKYGINVRPVAEY